jgi:hypothetical protein
VQPCLAVGGRAHACALTGVGLWGEPGALPLFRNKPVAVIGGGDSAAEEATFLTKFASEVYVLVRRDKLRASAAMQRRLLSNPKIRMLWTTVAEAAEGDGRVLTALRTRNVTTGVTATLPVSGLFFAIGHEPNTAFLKDQLPTNATVRTAISAHTPMASCPSAHARHGVRPGLCRGTCWLSRERRARLCRACLRVAMCRTLSTARPSRPPAPGAWQRSRRSGGSKTRCVCR